MNEATYLDASSRGSLPSSSSSSSQQQHFWTKLRSIWRLKIVGLIVLLGSVFWLQTYHFQIGIPVNKNENNNLSVSRDNGKTHDSDLNGYHDGTKGSHSMNDPGVDDDDDDSVSDSSSDGNIRDGYKQPNLATPAPTPCPFLSPKITGQKNWTLYPPQAYEGLSLLRPYKESILMTAFPGCVPMVLPKQKLLLFTVLKVSSTVFTQVAKRLDGNPTWPNGCGNVQNPLTTNLTYLTDVPPTYAEMLLLDSNWTKAIFVRDPKERVLSAYLNKAVGETEYIKTRCCDQKSDQVHALLECHDPNSLPTISFDEFLRVVVPQCKDGHWCRQSDLLRPVQWEQVNFVGHFDRLEDDSRRLLDNVLGVWDEMGATGWPNGGLYAGSSTVKHQTGAHDRMRQFYTSELEAFADEWYEADYDSPYLGFTKYSLFES